MFCRLSLYLCCTFYAMYNILLGSYLVVVSVSSIVFCINVTELFQMIVERVLFLTSVSVKV